MSGTIPITKKWHFFSLRQFLSPSFFPVSCLLNIFFSLCVTASNFAHFLQFYWSVMNKFRISNAMCANLICAGVKWVKGVTFMVFGLWIFWQRKQNIWMVQIIAIKSISHRLYRCIQAIAWCCFCSDLRHTADTYFRI